MTMTAPADLTLEASSTPLSTTLRRWLAVTWTFFTVSLVVLADALGLRRLVAWMRGRARPERIDGPIALRLAFERLGPTYLKLGQLIGSSDGLFPRRYADELRKCLDRVPSFPIDVVHRTLAEELGRPHDEVFAELDPAPVAAASIAQVHFARLRSGEEVAVKVQRPNITELLRADVGVLRVLARGFTAIVPALHLANLVGIVDDLAETLAGELDFRREARAMREFNEILARFENEDVAAPRVHDPLVTARVLVMERFHGARVDDFVAARKGPADGEEKLLAGVRAWFQGLIDRGFFHGDVHAGNFLFLDDGRVGFLDFGIVGRLSSSERAQITEFVLAFQARSFERLADVLIAMGSVDAGLVDRARFAKDLERALAPIADREDFEFKRLIPEMLRVSVVHQMRMPREFVLVTKQLVYFDRYAKVIAGPQMNVLTDARVMGFLLVDAARAAAF